MALVERCDPTDRRISGGSPVGSTPATRRSGRLKLYEVLEYLAAFPYFGEDFPDSTVLEDFQALLNSWLAFK